MAQRIDENGKPLPSEEKSRRWIVRLVLTFFGYLRPKGNCVSVSLLSARNCLAEISHVNRARAAGIKNGTLCSDVSPTVAGAPSDGSRPGHDPHTENGPRPLTRNELRA
jgi:hypothetical protein